jgi:hypothetical protein
MPLLHLFLRQEFHGSSEFFVQRLLDRGLA